MSIHLTDSNPSQSFIVKRGKRRRVKRNFIEKLRSFALKELFIKQEMPEDETKGNGKSWKIKLVPSAWDDRSSMKK
jgi:hypothetical protein